MTREQKRRYYELCDKIFDTPEDTEDAKEFWAMLEIIRSDISREKKSNLFTLCLAFASTVVTIIFFIFFRK